MAKTAKRRAKKQTFDKPGRVPPVQAAAPVVEAVPVQAQQSKQLVEPQGPGSYVRSEIKTSLIVAAGISILLIILRVVLQ